jgi:hypothetical protein
LTERINSVLVKRNRHRQPLAIPQGLQQYLALRRLCGILEDNLVSVSA